MNTRTISARWFYFKTIVLFMYRNHYVLCVLMEIGRLPNPLLDGRHQTYYDNYIMKFGRCDMKKYWITLLLTMILFLGTLAGCGRKVVTEDESLIRQETVTVQTVQITDAPVVLDIGQEYVLGYTVSGSAEGVAAEFSSSDISVLTVTDEGCLIACGAGEATVTARYGRSSASIRVCVRYPQLSSIAFTTSECVLSVGETYQPRLLLNPDGAENETIVYTCEDPRIATVDANGTVSCIGVGTTELRAEAMNDATICCTMTVQGTCDQILGLSFEEPYYSMLPEMQTAPKLIVEPYGMTADGIVWTSSNDSIVSVSDDGTLTAHRIGTVDVTAEQGGMETSCVVRVTSRLAPDPLFEITENRYAEGTDGILRNLDAAVTDRAHLMLVGDLMCLPAQQIVVRDASGFNFNGSFSLVRDILTRSDLTVGNLETVLSASNPYAYEEEMLENNPNCNAPSTYLDAVKYAGFDAVVLANNHCGDGGVLGVYETRQQLKRYQLHSTGLFTDPWEQRYLLMDVNGIRIGILAYTDNVNAGWSIPGDIRQGIVNYFSSERLEHDVATLQSAGAEFIVCYMHWGKSNTHHVTKRQREEAQLVADAGVDLICGSHPHCLQEAEYLVAEDGRQVLCIYSLGNFVSGMGLQINNDTIILDVKLERTDGEIRLVDAGYIPCYVFNKYEDRNHWIVPIPAELNGGILDPKLEEARARISEIYHGILPEISTPD